MAFKGQVLDNPITGERIEFLETAADTDGALLRFELTVKPGGHVPGLHVHPTQEERFEIHEGSMKFRYGLRTVHAKDGDTVVVPPRKVHKFSNSGKDAVRAVIEVRPALKMEELLETSHALAVNGRTNRKGMPKPLDLALFMRSSGLRCGHRSLPRPSSVPRWLRWWGWPPGAASTRLRLWMPRSPKARRTRLSNRARPGGPDVLRARICRTAN